MAKVRATHCSGALIQPYFYRLRKKIERPEAGVALVFCLAPPLLLFQTLDFFPPVVNDPSRAGPLAAATVGEDLARPKKMIIVP